MENTSNFLETFVKGFGFGGLYVQLSTGKKNLVDQNVTKGNIYKLCKIEQNKTNVKK